MMANYTIELYRLIEDKHFNIFDFEYDFYSDDIEVRKNFEKKFEDYFYFREIGQETVSRFKHQLRTKLNVIAPYYRQLYETELASKEINFLLNKDLKEEFIIEVTGSGSSSANTKGTSNATNVGENDSRFFDTPQQGIDNLDKYVTNVTKDKTNASTDTTIDNTSTSTSESSSTQKQTNLSQGNIGITSSAELLQKWRDVLINIDQLSLGECEDLFMQIY